MKFLAVLVACLLSTIVISEESMPIKFSLLPIAVQNKAAQLVDSKNVHKIGVRSKNKNRIFEMELKDDDKNREVSFSSDGHIFKVEAISSVVDMPIAAQNAIREKYDLLEILEVESVQLNYHEIEGTINGVKIELKVYASGKVTIKKSDED